MEKEQILFDACYEAARSVLWQTPEPRDIDDIIDTDQISSLSKRFYKIAERYFEFVAEQNRDPNLIARAVLYLAHVHTVPPMKENTEWFEERMEALIELACPNSILTTQVAQFLNDIDEGIKIARLDVKHKT